MPVHHALIVDDEPDIRELLQMTLERMDFQVTAAADLGAARRALGSEQFQLCFTDMRLPDGDGLELVRLIGQRYPALPVAVITAYGNTESAVEALKSGAFDFVTKPVDLKILRSLVNTALKLSPDLKQTRDKPEVQLLGRSAAMRQIRATINKLARSQAPIYISGESGVGKELAARMIHEQGPRADGPFVPVNCGAIPSELMESEFFGHKKGSFTGAHADKEGLFHAANGGTLFLDEVAELPLHMQVKLLRAIQEKAVRPIGAREEFPLDVRILSATQKPLDACVERGEFRQDLYYRINVIELHMPSLRERPEDIPELAEHLLARIAPTWGLDKPELTAEAAEKLKNYHFPGNVRELENILERALTLSDGAHIEVHNLQLKPTNVTGEQAVVPDRGGQSLEDYMTSIERDSIVKALEETRYNKTAAARKLGITFRALRYRLKKLGME